MRRGAQSSSRLWGEGSPCDEVRAAIVWDNKVGPQSQRKRDTGKGDLAASNSSDPLVGSSHCLMVLLKPQPLGEVADLLQQGFQALQEHVLQIASHSGPNTGLFSLSGLQWGLRLCKSLSFLHPLLQQ